MGEVDGQIFQLGRRTVGWMGTWMALMAASCRFDLPNVSGDDAPSGTPHIDGAHIDGPLVRPPQYTSCMGMAATCGASGTASCCEAATTIPGGMFYRSYDNSGFYDHECPATVSAFVLDRYEVTVGRFRAFVNAGLGTQASSPAAGTGAHPKLAGSGWASTWNASLVVNTDALIAAVKCYPTAETWTDAPGANENKPMTCVTWYEAMAFCIWDGGYLPTEAEWNYAASGGNEQRAYPWSSPAQSTSIDCTYANYYSDGGYCSSTARQSPVGSKSPKGDGKWGHSDLAGNVWEWILDWYGMYPMPCNDCGKLTSSSNRVMRGGDYGDDALHQRVALRKLADPSNRYFAYGFRCARTP